MAMKNTNPAAFLSYVHTDDKYGQVSTLRERLSDEVSVTAQSSSTLFSFQFTCLRTRPRVFNER